MFCRKVESTDVHFLLLSRTLSLARIEIAKELKLSVDDFKIYYFGDEKHPKTTRVGLDSDLEYSAFLDQLVGFGRVLYIWDELSFAPGTSASASGSGGAALTTTAAAAKPRVHSPLRDRLPLQLRIDTGMGSGSVQSRDLIIPPSSTDFSNQESMRDAVIERDGRCVITYDPKHPTSGQAAEPVHVWSASNRYRKLPADSYVTAAGARWIPMQLLEPVDPPLPIIAGADFKNGSKKSPTLKPLIGETKSAAAKPDSKHPPVAATATATATGTGTAEDLLWAYRLQTEHIIHLPNNYGSYNSRLAILADRRFNRLFECGLVWVRDGAIKYSAELKASTDPKFQLDPSLAKFENKPLRVPSDKVKRESWPPLKVFASHADLAPTLRSVFGCDGISKTPTPTATPSSPSPSPSPGSPSSTTTPVGQGVTACTASDTRECRNQPSTRCTLAQRKPRGTAGVCKQCCFLALHPVEYPQCHTHDHFA